MARARATFVAAIDGLAIGAGVELLSACDLRIATERASFRVPVAKLGVVYHADGIARIRAAFGPALTARMLLLQHKIGPQEALDAGALIRVVAPTELDEELRRTWAALQSAVGVSLRGSRQVLRALSHGELSPELRDKHERLRRHAYASGEHQAAAERLAALLKRGP